MEPPIIILNQGDRPMYVILITWKTGLTEWYSYCTKGQMQRAKDIWDKDSMVQATKAGHLSDI